MVDTPYSEWPQADWQLAASWTRERMNREPGITLTCCKASDCAADQLTLSLWLSACVCNGACFCNSAASMVDTPYSEWPQADWQLAASWTRERMNREPGITLTCCKASDCPADSLFLSLSGSRHACVMGHVSATLQHQWWWTLPIRSGRRPTGNSQRLGHASE